MVTVSVIVPVYNEEQTIQPILERVAAQRIDGVSFEVVVVDDGSTDATVARLKERPDLYARLIARPNNGGKGAAVKDGLGAANGEYVLFQDADLEYDPDDYGRLLLPVLRHQADLVLGSRFAAPPYTRVFYFWHRLGNRFITLLFNLMHNTTFTDIYTCYLLYRKALVDPLMLAATGWEQQAEILSRAVKAGRVYYEVPISYHGRTYGEGKKIKAYHVIAVLAKIVTEGLRPRRR
ncbi:MAG: glycosyltransferase family 2 protein [Rhodospirillales bacterium]|nr:glycosyltransferase family 2 protein [Rhodospirillales bacterium]